MSFITIESKNFTHTTQGIFHLIPPIQIDEMYVIIKKDNILKTYKFKNIEPFYKFNENDIIVILKCENYSEIYTPPYYRKNLNLTHNAIIKYKKFLGYETILFNDEKTDEICIVSFIN
jgi:hypothetical protein